MLTLDVDDGGGEVATVTSARSRLTLSAIKADIGSIGGHTLPSVEMLQAASQMLEARRSSSLIDFRVTHTGDDICL